MKAKKALKQKMYFRRTLREESWDKIVIWENGTWAKVSSGYAGEQDGNNPFLQLSRTAWYNLTYKEVSVCIKWIDGCIENGEAYAFPRED